MKRNIILLLNKLLLLYKLLKLLNMISIDSSLLELFNNELNNINPEENPNDKKKRDINYINRNVLFLKLIVSIGIIGIFQLNTEQIGCVIVANLISELIEAVVFYNDGEFIEKENHNGNIKNVANDNIVSDNNDNKENEKTDNSNNNSNNNSDNNSNT